VVRGHQVLYQNLISDIALRDYLKVRLKNAALSTIVIERPAQSINITVHTGVPASSSARRARTSRSCARR